MAATLYEVVFVNQSGAHERSRLFNTIRAARNWSKWLAKYSYVKQVLIYRGGAGGELVQ